MKTIFSLITAPYSPSAVHIIRISGQNTYQIVQKIAKAKIKKEANKIQYLFLYDGDLKIDEVLILKFLKPHSFTGEDSIEICCHGSMVIVQEICALLLKHGAQQAKPGEFSKTAILNKKIDISQAIAINELCKSETLFSKQIALTNVLGITKSFFYQIRNKIFEIIGNSEVLIDYPEFDDAIEFNNKEISTIILDIKQQLSKIINDYEKYKNVFKGINVCIIGEPNVGKSSLFNALVKQDRAIVSAIAGTTRDYLETGIIINNIKYNFIDTAGLREDVDFLEQKGIEKSLALIKQADLILYIINPVKNSYNLNEKYLNIIKNKKYFIVCNKADLLAKDAVIEKNFIYTSVINNDITNLLEKLEHVYNINDLLVNNIYVSDQNQIAIINEIIIKIEHLIKDLNYNLSIEFILFYLEEILDLINIVLGEKASYVLHDEIFKNFCLGK